MRLAAQDLVVAREASPAAVVARLGAMQAQDWAGVRWGVGLRATGVTDAAVARALADGDVVRTHLLRPTWHLVARHDLRWLLALSAPRVKAHIAPQSRELGVDATLLAKVRAALERLLGGGRAMTREGIADALAAARLAPGDGRRQSYLMMHLELDGVLCSGPRDGTRFTYMLVDERVPASPARDRDEALADLAGRYFRTRGPATAHDFAWWSGLTVGDARRGAAAAQPRLAQVEVDGVTHWHDPEVQAPARRAERVHLLPAYDEWFIGLRDRSAMLATVRAAGATLPERALGSWVLALDGQVAGNWWRRVTRGEVRVRLDPVVPLTAAQRRGALAAAERYAAFAGLARAALE